MCLMYLKPKRKKMAMISVTSVERWDTIRMTALNVNNGLKGKVNLSLKVFFLYV